MNRILIIFAFLSLSGIPCLAEDWSEDFEYGTTHTDSEIRPGDSVILLDNSGELREWPDSNGKGVVEYDTPGFRDDFTYRKRSGSRLLGVSGIRFSHPEGVDIRTTGVLRWGPAAGKLKPVQTDSTSAIHGAFGLNLFLSAYGLSKPFPETREVYVRFYLEVRKVQADSPSKGAIIIHRLDPDNLVTVGLAPESDSSARLRISVPGNAGQRTWVHSLRYHRPVCIEYLIRPVSPDGRAFETRAWLDNEGLGTETFHVRPGAKPPVFFSLIFGHYRPVRNRPTIRVDIRIDDIRLSDKRIGPKAGAPVMALVRQDSLRWRAGPEDTLNLTGMEIRISPDRIRRWPFIYRKQEPVLFSRVFLKDVLLPDPLLALTGRVKREGFDWSEWGPGLPARFEPLHPEARPRVDSVIVTDRPTGKKTDTLFIGHTYDLRVYAQDPKGFMNLLYSHVYLNRSDYPECDVWNKGGVFDPARNYFLSQSRELASDRTLVYVREKPGSSYTTSVSPICTTFVDGREAPFVVDTAKQAWKTHFKLPLKALPGAWLLQVAVFNQEELGSPVLRKKMTVAVPRPVPAQRARVWMLVLIVVGTAAGAGFAVFKRKRGPASEARSADVLDYRVKLAREYIHANYTKDISVATVAEHLNTNQAWLGMLFKKQIGTGINAYLNDLRCKAAIPLLEENVKNISEVSYVVGFNNPGYFKDVFKEVTGKSPSQYRKDFLQSAPPKP